MNKVTLCRLINTVFLTFFYAPQSEFSQMIHHWQYWHLSDIIYQLYVSIWETSSILYAGYVHKGQLQKIKNYKKESHPAS